MRLIKIALWLVVSANVWAGSDSQTPKDYKKLVDFANLASFAYCIKKGLATGYLGDSETGCRLSTCSTDEYSGIEVVKTFNSDESQNVGTGYCAIDRKHKRIILSFRGTSSRRDWVSNIDFLPTSYDPVSYDQFLEKCDSEPQCDGCSVHRGFYQILQTTLVPVMKHTADLLDKYPDYELHISGHSLGGALSILVGLEFQLMGYDPLVVSLASPKIGNKQFANFIDQQFNTKDVSKFIDAKHNFKRGLIRVTHKGDIVPSLPPSILYSHAGYEYHIDKTDTPHLPEDIERLGSSNDNTDEYVVDLDLKNFGNPSKLIPTAFYKNEHVNYFFKISGCDD